MLGGGRGPSASGCPVPRSFPRAFKAICLIDHSLFGYKGSLPLLLWKPSLLLEDGPEPLSGLYTSLFCIHSFILYSFCIHSFSFIYSFILYFIHSVFIHTASPLLPPSRPLTGLPEGFDLQGVTEGTW